MDDIELLKRKLERERKARKLAEGILEKRALELYRLNEQLEFQVAERTKELRISEEKYRGIIENMELGLLEVNNNQKIIRAYDWFCDMTGYSEEELLGENALEFLVPNEELRKRSIQQNEKRKTGQAGVYEMQIKHKKGHYIWVLISGNPVIDTDGNVIGSIGIHYDITERKTLEQDLIKAKRAAELAQEAEKQFLANMSHEMRTPLNSIIGMSHLLQDSNPSEEQKEYISILNQSSHILKSLISDILDISKIQAGKIEIQSNEFNIWEIIQNFHRLIQLRTAEKDIIVSYEIDLKIDYYLIGDELLLNQILNNILGNAAKFTLVGEINIFVKVIHETEEFVTIEFKIQDTGIGISKKQQNQIFSNFKRAKHRNTDLNFDGTGLGLAITKKLIELQKGKISVESKIDKGSTFIFDLKYEKSNQIQFSDFITTDVVSIPNFKNYRVLVVEDNIMNQKYISILLKKWKISFDFANNGLIGLEKVFVHQYDLIFMDISMPEMDGYECTKSIRAVENPNQNTPIIALSALAFKQEKEKALQTGMNDFLAKPFSPPELLQILKNYLNPLSETQYQPEEKIVDVFSEKLDVVQLNNLYQNDYDYALEMFELFIEHSIPNFKKIESSIQDKNWDKVKKEIHKLKPNFTMVGLTELRSKIEKMETLVFQKSNEKVMIEKYNEIKIKLNHLLPEITATIKKLKDKI